MREKLRIGLLLQPLATALFANSPFTEGKPNGFMSARANVWTDTDPDRTGIPHIMLAPDFGFEQYIEWVLGVPMYFVARDGKLIDVAGASFRDYLAGKVPALKGLTPTLGDFADHLTTVFPDVRLKKFLEMRGADAGSPAMMLAQSAFWTGLLYDPAAQSSAAALVASRAAEAFVSLRALVPRQGLATKFASGTLRDLARDVLAIARDGLIARGKGEEVLLAPLHDIAAGAPTQAECWLAKYHGAWGRDVTRIFEEANI
jgi:glutamate--cysteine ligase